MVRRARLERVAGRALLSLLGLGAAGAALLTWWTAARVATAGGAPWTIAPPAAALVLLVGALALRRRWVPRLGALRALVLLLGGLVPLLGLEGAANLVDAGGYLYYADCLRYFRWQRYDVLPDHAHPPIDGLALSWGRIETDARGWRREGPAQSPPEALRVLALGDSVVFGWGVPGQDSVCPQVERALTARTGRAVQVQNAGNGSYTSLDELLCLQEKGLEARPEAVFLLAIENDFRDRPPYRDQVAWLRAQGAAPALLATLDEVAVERPGPRGPVSQPWSALYGAVAWGLHRSYLLVNLAQWVERRAARSPSQGPDQPPAPLSQPLTTNAPIGTGTAAPGAGPADVPVAPADPHAERQALEARLTPRFPWLVAQTACLEEVARLCRQAGLPLTLCAYCPGDPELVRWLRLAFPDLVVLEVEPGRLRSLQRSDTDPHWNAAGSAEFARQIARALRLPP